MSKKCTMCTINGRNWENKRGLTQVAIETMEKVARKTKKNFSEYIEALEKAYNNAIRDTNSYMTHEREMKLVKDFVHVQKSIKEME